MLERLTTFLKEARIELKKVTWPTRRDTVRYTLAVILLSLAVAVFLGALDVGFTYLLNKFVL
ncbi:MAG: preprotein translocase subunit SecE [Candidatus Sungbacteria bacterium]|uniref:Protein translocase subunit SecE n=1 Tax=Candidatus Sungiibacteriota bacterium TaxID=2750080 RepID=A0A932YZ05_9BACT|nr:preprotein translocase subunit SecE [Candidatus Sungbacteria bacterium]